MDDGTVRTGLNGRGDGRGERGRWAPGNRAAHGNPNALKQFRLRQEILDSAAASPEAVKAAFSRLFWRAVGKREDKDGSSVDLEAMKVYLGYAVGRPVQALELSGSDGEPLLGLEWAKVEDAVIAALAPFGPAARFAVAAALRGIVKDAGDPESPGTPA